MNAPGPPLLEIVDLVRHFPVRDAFGRRTGWIRAVDGVSLAVDAGGFYASPQVSVPLTGVKSAPLVALAPTVA